MIVEEAAWRAAEPKAAALTRAAARAALKHECAPRGASLAILLTGDAQLQALNGRFRARPAPTNVLSFPSAGAGPGELGDIALAFGVCAREAAEQGKSLAAHLQHLTTHGVLHLMGYDHQTDAEAEAMESRERAILEALGVGDPYAAREG
ncbi:MAG TPA: rRNA maturation RNase YbeY [Caulobacteraceae bacterium]